jgi:hypothetical protein
MRICATDHEAIVRKRGRNISFLFVEVRTVDGVLVAEGSVSYKVSTHDSVREADG